MRFGAPRAEHPGCQTVSALTPLITRFRYESAARCKTGYAFQWCTPFCFAARVRLKAPGAGMLSFPLPCDAATLLRVANNIIIPAALTVAGSDSGGGAGVQADLKTFAALRVHGTCAITCITAQNLDGVTGIESCPPGMVAKQMEAVMEGFHPAAAKTGMLYSAEIIRSVVRTFKRGAIQSIVVDPVMIATSGSVLLKRNALEVLGKTLFPMAALLTPNLDEAVLITGEKIRTIEDMRLAARRLQKNTARQCCSRVATCHNLGRRWIFCSLALTSGCCARLIFVAFARTEPDARIPPPSPRCWLEV